MSTVYCEQAACPVSRCVDCRRENAKALSVRQPWAELIVAGLKPIENRSWMTRYRGALLIHASQRIDRHAYRQLDELGLPIPDPDRLERGGIIGRAQLVDVVRDADDPWTIEGCWHWRLERPERLPFQPMPGRLGLWTPSRPRRTSGG